MTIALSPSGPAPQDVEVLIGGQSTATPDADGQIADAPDDGATCTVFATEEGSGDLLLMSVVPAAAMSPAQTTAGPEVSPETTVHALLFYRLGGWLVSQDEHDQVLALLGGVSEVQHAVDLLAADYEQTGGPLEDLVADAQFESAMDDAAEAAAQALADSSLAEEMQKGLGGLTTQAAEVRTRDWEVDPWYRNGVDCDVRQDDEDPERTEAIAENEFAIYRWAEVTDRATGDSLGWKILGDAGLILGPSETTLAPDPLPARSPLDLTVTGGLDEFDPGGAEMEHVVPVGMTVSLRVIIPVVSCVVGVPGVQQFNPIGTAMAPNGGWNTGHPLVNWSLKQFAWDWTQPAASLGKPVPNLMSSLSVAAANGDGLINVITGWTWQTLLPAMAQDPGGLTAAIVAEFGDDVALSIVAQGIGIIVAPWLVAAVRGYMVASTIVAAGPAAIDLLQAKFETYFTISATGTGEVIISAVPEPGGTGQ